MALLHSKPRFSSLNSKIMSLSTNRSDPERVEYHNWLLRIQDQQLREELLGIVSIQFYIFLSEIIF